MRQFNSNTYLLMLFSASILWACETEEISLAPSSSPEQEEAGVDKSGTAQFFSDNLIDCKTASWRYIGGNNEFFACQNSGSAVLQNTLYRAGQPCVDATMYIQVTGFPSTAELWVDNRYIGYGGRTLTYSIPIPRSQEYIVQKIEARSCGTGLPQAATVSFYIQRTSSGNLGGHIHQIANPRSWTMLLY